MFLLYMVIVVVPAYVGGYIASLREDPKNHSHFMRVSQLTNLKVR